MAGSLSVSVQCQHVNGLSPDGSTLIQPLAGVPGKQRSVAHRRGTHVEDTEEASDEPSSSNRGDLGSESAEGKTSVSPSLCTSASATIMLRRKNCPVPPELHEGRCGN